jgi:hypothetical protein
MIPLPRPLSVLTAFVSCLVFALPALAQTTGTETVCGVPASDDGSTVIDDVVIEFGVWEVYVFDAVEIAEAVNQPICAELERDADDNVVSAIVTAELAFCGEAVTQDVDTPTVAGAVIDPTITSTGLWELLLLAGAAGVEACIDVQVPGQFAVDVTGSVAEACADVVAVGEGTLSLSIPQYDGAVTFETEEPTEGIEVGSLVCVAAHAGEQGSPIADSFRVERGPVLLPDTALPRTSMSQPDVGRSD